MTEWCADIRNVKVILQCVSVRISVNSLCNKWNPLLGCAAVSLGMWVMTFQNITLASKNGQKTNRDAASHSRRVDTAHTFFLSTFSFLFVSEIQNLRSLTIEHNSTSYFLTWQPHLLGGLQASDCGIYTQMLFQNLQEETWRDCQR